MTDAFVARISRRIAIVFIAIVSAQPAGRADEKEHAGRSRDEALAIRRFELMRTRVTAGKVESEEPGFPRAFSPEPVFRYSDPTRGFVAGAVWKLGNEGRPKALLASELRRAVRGRPSISYEFTSLTTTQFTLRSDDMAWSPTGTQFEFKPVAGAPAPGRTPQHRLRQFHAIARRFTSNEVINKQHYELRLLPTPVDRYAPSEADGADGAVFFFTLGTNPEVVLLVETDGKGWGYAAGRMTGAQAVVVALDGAVVWEGTTPRMRGDSSFTGTVKPIEIPGIAADGSELPE